jgi:hypothetical protein
MTDSGGSRRPNAGRIYNCLLGGKDNYGEDREAAGRLLAVVPDARAAAWDSRRFAARAVRFLVKDAGIRQFIDIGTGLPVMGNVHEVAHELAPDTRVAYVDNDPVVVCHARALLCTAPGICAIEGDLRDPSGILEDPVLRAQVDLREPVAIVLAGVLHFIPDDDDPYRLVNTLKAAMAPGSHLVISHLTSDSIAPEALEQAQAIYEQAAAPVAPRSRASIARFHVAGRPAARRATPGDFPRRRREEAMSDLTSVQRAGVRPTVRSTERVIARRAGLAAWRWMSAADGMRARQTRDGLGSEDGQRSTCQAERGSGPGAVPVACRAGSSPSGCGSSGLHVAAAMLTGAP